MPFPVAAYRRIRTEYEPMKLLALPLAVLAFHGSIQPLRPPLRAQMAEHRWHRGGPVSLSGLRVVTVKLLGLRRPCPKRSTGREPGGRGAAARRLPPALRTALSDPADGAGGQQRRRHVRLRLPQRRSIALLRRLEHRPLVDARVRRGDRPEPDREPLHRLRPHPRAPQPPLPRPLAPAQGHGHAGRRRGLPLDRLGLGRRLGRHEGLHALLRPRPLETWPATTATSTSLWRRATTTPNRRCSTRRSLTRSSTSSSNSPGADARWSSGSAPAGSRSRSRSGPCGCTESTCRRRWSPGCARSRAPRTSASRSATSRRRPWTGPSPSPTSSSTRSRT